MPSRVSPYVNPVDRHVGAMVKLYRMMKGYTQVTLAEALGVSSDTVYKIERGFVPLTPIRVVRLSALLGVGAGTFFHNAPTGFQLAAPIDTGTMANADTRRLLRAWDAIGGNARKRMLGIAITVAQACRERAELARLRSTEAKSAPGS